MLKKLDRKRKSFHLHTELDYYSEFLFPICIIMIELFQYFLAFSIQHSSVCAILALRVNWCTILLADLLEKSFWLKFTMHGEQPVIMLVTTVTMFYY